MVHQHFKLVGCYTAIQNIILGDEPTTLGFLRPKKVRKSLEDLCTKYKFQVDLDRKIDDMPVGEQQKVEILKMLYRKNDILIFDEPTAVLTPQEIEDLMQSMKSLAKEGKSILFISHKLNEIMEVADRVTVLRKGKCLGTLDIKDTNPNALSKLMVGRDVALVTQKKPAVIGEDVLSVSNLVVQDPDTKKKVVNHVSFDVRKGEIVCIAGIEGNGQTQLIYALTGLMKAKKGEIILHHVDSDHYNVSKKKKGDRYQDVHLENLSVRKRSLAGISHIPEDRQKYGLALDFSLRDNLVLQRYFEKGFERLGFINGRKDTEYANKIIKQYDIRSSMGTNTIVRSMSGGNQQKAIVGRELDRGTPLLIAVQPTRGLDVGAIEYIHKQILKSRDSGNGVLLVSLELDEVMNLSDRILVMFEGEIVAELDPRKTNVNEIGLYMSGAKRMNLATHEDMETKKPLKGDNHND